MVPKPKNPMTLSVKRLDARQPHAIGAKLVSLQGAAEPLPSYAEEIAAFHRAFAAELKGVVAGLPLTPEMRVLDVGCGDGFYMTLFAERLRSPGGITGLDISESYLKLARQNANLLNADCGVDFILGDLSHLPAASSDFDLAWCAQSLYSLPEPVAALRQMAAALRPGGILAVLENDTLHQVLLPWPSHLEIALRAAEFVELARQSHHPGKYYVGRRLPAVFAAAGLEPLGFRTQCIDRQAPLDQDLTQFLDCYLRRLAERVEQHLHRPQARELAQLIDPNHDKYLPRQPYFTMSWLNVLVWGRKPLSPGPGGTTS